MYKTIAKNEHSYYRKLGYFGVGIFWWFSVKMWMFNFWCFPKDACFILVLFKWLEKNKCL
jgi:hypothetical protein